MNRIDFREKKTDLAVLGNFWASILLLYDDLTSCKKSEETVETILRSCIGWADG